MQPNQAVFLGARSPRRRTRRPVDVVCHVFSQEGRMYYDLDNLWGDAKRVEWETGENPVASSQ